MSVRVKSAETAAELDAAFRLRHDVFVGEGYLEATRDGRICDRFDAYPGTTNLIALHGDEVVGAVRYMRVTDAGSSLDAHWPDAVLPVPIDQVAVGSMLAVRPDVRGAARLTFNLCAMGLYWAASQGLSHVVGVVNPDREAGFRRAGFRPLAAPVTSAPIRRVPVQPMIAALDDLDDRFLDFLRRHGGDFWLSAFERQFHAAGDAIVRRGDPGDAAFIIVHGIAEIVGAHGGVVRQLERGDLFGEIALLTGRVRTATVRAATDVDLVVLSRDRVRAHLRRDPDAAERLLDLLANRIADAAHIDDTHPGVPSLGLRLP